MPPQYVSSESASPSVSVTPSEVDSEEQLAQQLEQSGETNGVGVASNEAVSTIGTDFYVELVELYRANIY
jgi:hypothetical protein